MDSPQQSRPQLKRPAARAGLFLAITCNLLGVSEGAAPSSFSPAFAAPKNDGVQRKREPESKVRLFSRGPDTQLSASTLAYTADDFGKYAGVVADPFDPEFRPPASTFWGPAPMTVKGTESAGAVAATIAISKDSPFKIFCDLDGVLVDFEAGVQKICGQSTTEIAKTAMWQKIAASNSDFFEQLPWTQDGPKLWHAIRHLKPDILTGVPDMKQSRLEKYNWCRRNLGMTNYRHVDMAGVAYQHCSFNGNQKACPKKEADVTNIITCWSYNKHHEAGQYSILIDDRIALKQSWEASGGIFVHHTDTDSTLKQLVDLGILEQDDIPMP